MKLVNMNLPDEVTVYMLSFLEPVDILNFSQTCKDNYFIANDQWLWKQFAEPLIVGKYTQELVNDDYKKFYFSVKNDRTMTTKSLSNMHYNFRRMMDVTSKTAPFLDYARFLARIGEHKKAIYFFEKANERATEREKTTTTYAYASYLANVDQTRSEKMFAKIFNPDNIITTLEYADLMIQVGNYEIAHAIYKNQVAGGNPFACIKYAKFLWKYCDLNDYAKQLYVFGATFFQTYGLEEFMNFIGKKALYMTSFQKLQILETSPLFLELSQRDIWDIADIEDLHVVAICYTEIKCYDQAENWYKTAINLEDEHNVQRYHTKSNYAEILLHWKEDHATAEQLYQKAIVENYGNHPTAKLGLLTSRLSRGEQCLDELRAFIGNTKHNTRMLLEALLLYYVFTDDWSTLKKIKRMLIQQRIRVGLCIEYDAQFRHCVKNSVFKILLYSLYNCEIYNHKILDMFEEWKSIEVEEQKLNDFPITIDVNTLPN